ncbi:hypothetical protein AXG93_107s1060 [Marchantia polymorpha subsp. ruderalis]|nr:hypothetical protein AXG93_107s1060 [Marchantia polymorpha subsp. ruderalis]
MSLVRICVMSMTILRFFLCMCSRARQKERKKKRQTLTRQATDEEEACGSIIELYTESERTAAEAKRDLKLHTSLFKKKNLSFASTLSKGCDKRELGPLASHLANHPKLGDKKSRQFWQDEKLHQLLKRGLLRMWRWTNKCERHKESQSLFQSTACNQVTKRGLFSDGKDSGDTMEEESRVPAIAWGESSETYEFETPSCSYRQDESNKRPAGTQDLEETLKTLLDDFLQKDGAPTFSYKECLEYFGDTCPCRFLLPNQIAGMDLRFRATSSSLPPVSTEIELRVEPRVAFEDLEYRRTEDPEEPAEREVEIIR